MTRKKWMIFGVLLACRSVLADPYALLGGTENTNPYGTFVNSTGLSLLPLNLSSGSISSVALNRSEIGLIGGYFNNGSNRPYAAFAFPGTSPTVTVISPLSIATGKIASVAINSSGAGLIGGYSNTPNPYAAFVQAGSSSPASTVSFGGISGQIFGVSINNNQLGLLGGVDYTNSLAYASFITSGGSPSNLLSFNGFIQSVSVNDAAIAVIGGSSGSSAPFVPYAAFASQTSIAPVPIAFANFSNGQINSVAINSNSVALIGGQDTGHNVAYASLVGPLDVSSNLLTFTGSIDAVSLNNAGQGLIGGQNGSAPYAGFVQVGSSSVTPISFDFSSGIINSVAINQFGQGLVGGQNGSSAFAALVDSNYPFHAPFVISSLPNLGSILSVGYVPSAIPTTGLDDNNARFARYINQNALRDVFYLYPSVLAGNLADALESAAPTRNAISLFTSENNLFFLTHGLSLHLRNQRHFKQRLSFRTPPGETAALTTEESETSDDELVAFRDMGLSRIGFGKKQQECCEVEEKVCRDPSPLSIWVEAIGALVYQKSQKQTAAFDPQIGGGILAFDGQVTDYCQLGLGAAYTFTHIHEKDGRGSSNINQEYAFLYMTTSDERWYFDLAFWGGLFQIRQTRKIEMTGWDFQARSKPSGWQVAPHLEMGYDYVGVSTQNKKAELVVNLFAMGDWANAWQSSYKEKGDSPFNAAQRAHYSSLVRAETGLRFYEPISFDCWSLVFQEKLSYVNKTPFRIGKMQAFLVGSPGSFTLETLTEAQNLGVAEAALIFESKGPSGAYGSISYQGEFGTKYQSHQLTFEVSWNF